MEKIKVYDLEGKTIEEMELPSDIFGVAIKPDVVHQVMIALLANKRGPYAHTKTRGEVRGGGKKPWKQKGTGRARHGSSRSPIWVGGGVTFGPRNERNYQVKINKKVKKLALRMLLSDKLAKGGLVAVDKIALAEPKTKIFASALKNLFAKIGKEAKGRGLLVSDDNKSAKLAGRNIRQFKNASSDLSILDAMNSDYMILERSALQALIKRLG